MSISVVGTGTFGAVVTGADLRALDDELWREIESAFYEHGLLVFPGQELDAEQQATFGRRFGSLRVSAAPLSNVVVDGKRVTDATLPGATVMSDLASAHHGSTRGNARWHADGSFAVIAHKASILAARVVPSEGGETEFCDLAAAYDALPDDMVERLEGLVATHLYFAGDVAELPPPERAAWIEEKLAAEPPARHPVLLDHPVTGRRVLYVARHILRIDGMDDAETWELVDALIEHACQPSRIYLHRWRIGDVVAWDNQRALHRGRLWDLREPRILIHTRVAGDGDTEGELVYE